MDKYHVIEARITGLRSLELVEMKPAETGVTEIKGANGQGKSTVLDAFLLTLSGGKIPNGIVKNGAESADITIEIGNSRKNYVIKKHIDSDGKGSLEVKLDGEAEIKSPQSFLQDISGAVTFSPADFYELMKSDKAENARAIRDKLLEVGGVSAQDLRSLERDKKSVYDERTLVNRELKKLQAETADEPEKVESVDVVQLSGEVDAKRNEFFELQKLIDERNAYVEEDKQIRTQIEELQGKLVKHEQMIEELPALNKQIDTVKEAGQEAKRKLELASDINARALKYGEWEKKSAECNSKSAEYDNLNEQYKQFDEKFKDLLKTAKLPAGLEFGDDSVTYMGRMLSQLSDSEKMKLAFEVSIAQNPELPLVLMEGGERFDSKKRAEIDELARALDVQVLLEVVDDSDPTNDGAVWIVEGRNA